MTRSILALGVTAGGILAATSGAGGQSGQPGQTQSCTSQVQTTSSSGPITQSNSSSVSQSAVGGSGSNGAPGGEASCNSTVVQTNSQTGAGGNVTHVQGTGSAPLSGKLTADRIRRQIQAIIKRLDPAATVRAPSCRRTGSASLRCRVVWRSSAGTRARLRVDFRHRGKRLVWRYDASRSG